MKFLRTDLRRVLTEPSFYISVALGLVLMFGAFAALLAGGNTERLYLTAQSLAFPFAAPVLAALPYSVMIMQEKETRYSTLMGIKLGRRGYQLRRLLVCGCSGAMALLLPQLVLFIVCAFMGGLSDIGFEVLTLLLPVSFGFGYASIAYGLTFVNSQRYVPTVMPQVLYLLCIYAFPHLGLEKYYPPLDISPTIYGGEITPVRFALPLALTAAAVLLTLLGKAGDRR